MKNHKRAMRLSTRGFFDSKRYETYSGTDFQILNQTITQGRFLSMTRIDGLAMRACFYFF